MKMLYAGIIIGIIIGVFGIELYGSFLKVEELRQPWHEQEGTNWVAYIRGVVAERDYMACTLSLYPIRCHSDFPDWYLEKLEDVKYKTSEGTSFSQFVVKDNMSPEPEHSIYAFAFEGNDLSYDPWDDPNFIMCEDPKDPRCKLTKFEGEREHE